MGFNSIYPYALKTMLSVFYQYQAIGVLFEDKLTYWERSFAVESTALKNLREFKLKQLHTKKSLEELNGVQLTVCKESLH